MSIPALLATAAFSAGKNKDSKTQNNPTDTFKESVFNKPVTWLIITGVVGFFVIKYSKNVAAAFKKWQKGKDIKKERDALAKTQSLTYPISQYQIFATSLYDAFVGGGTDNDRVKSVMSQIRNDLDVLKLIEVYDTRDGGTSWWSPDMTLIEQIPYDMTDSEIETYVNGPLRSNGVTYKF